MQLDPPDWRTAALLLMWVASACPPVTADTGPGAPTTGGRIELTLGDYRFTPPHFEVTAASPVALVLRNRDTLTPHNFTLKDAAGNLDIDTARHVMDYLMELNRQGSTVIMATHDLYLLDTHPGDIFRLHAGALAEEFHLVSGRERAVAEEGADGAEI